MNQVFAKFSAFRKKSEGQEAHKNHYFLRIPLRDRILFVKRLSILIQSGVPIAKALNMMHSQAQNKATRRILGQIKDDVESGQSLSAGLNKFNKVFGDYSVNIVRVGEVGGTLSQNLNYLAEELRKSQELRRKITSALVYPVFIVIATLAITILLTAYVFPKIMPIFQSFNFKLPITTRILISVSTFMQHDWLYVVLGLIVLVVGTIGILKVRKLRVKIDRHTLKLPLLGNLFQSYYIANFTRTLGLLIKSDVRIVEALQIVSSTMSNLAYRDEFLAMAEELKSGSRISQFMELDTKLFPPMLTQMVAIGESTGNLSETLMYLSEMYEDELNNLTKNLSTSIEPILMIFMGLLVGFIAISIITPLYGITQNLRP